MPVDKSLTDAQQWHCSGTPSADAKAYPPDLIPPPPAIPGRPINTRQQHNAHTRGLPAGHSNRDSQSGCSERDRGVDPPGPSPRYSCGLARPGARAGVGLHKRNVRTARPQGAGQRPHLLRLRRPLLHAGLRRPLLLRALQRRRRGRGRGLRGLPGRARSVGGRGVALVIAAVEQQRRLLAPPGLRRRRRPLPLGLCAVALKAPRCVGRLGDSACNDPPPPCDIPSRCCSFTGPWTVTRSSLRMLRRVAAFCRPLRPVLLLVSFPRSRSPVVWCAGAVLDVGLQGSRDGDPRRAAGGVWGGGS